MKKQKIDFRNPRVRNPIIIILLGCAGAFLWYQQFYTPTQQIVVDLNRSLDRKQDTLRTILALKPQLNTLKEEILAANIRLDSLKSIFPDQKEIPKLIREITSVARASGITTTKFNPLPDVQKEYYVENRYNIAIAGGYHQLGDFFSFLANFSLIINLSRVTIASNPGFLAAKASSDFQGLIPPTIVASFEMTTFSSKR